MRASLKMESKARIWMTFEAPAEKPRPSDCLAARNSIIIRAVGRRVPDRCVRASELRRQQTKTRGSSTE